MILAINTKNKKIKGSTNPQVKEEVEEKRRYKERFDYFFFQVYKSINETRMMGSRNITKFFGHLVFY